MTRTMRVTADASKVSMAASIRAVASAAPLFVIGVRALGDLAAELGSMDAATTFLLGVAESLNKPIGVNLPGVDGASKTAFLAPRHWGEERLQGWIAGHHAELEVAFGTVSRVGAV